jgi:hypothetical protein
MVTKTAIAMPKIPYQTARFALSWFDRPPRERIKRTAAPIYAADTIPLLISSSP